MSNPTSWRGIALRCCALKVLTSLVATRLEILADREEFIPEEQHGFVRGRSTMTAIRGLLDEIQRAWRAATQAICAVFVDFKAAFDRASREAIAQVIAGLGAGCRLQGLIREILQEDKVTIYDGETIIGSLNQTSGIVQGDCLSPLLFVLLLGDLPRKLREEVRSVKTICNADDIVVIGKHRQAVQLALRELEAFCRNKGLVVNEEKTIAVEFRSGGGVRRDDVFWVGRRPI